MMTIIGDEPVLWVNVRSLVPTAVPTSKSNMEEWDEELLAACDAYPNMRIYDWASDVKDDWFIEDGIHFTSPGYAARAQADRQCPCPRLPRGRRGRQPRQRRLPGRLRSERGRRDDLGRDRRDQRYEHDERLSGRPGANQRFLK